MPATLNATAGDSAANSYADTNFVTTYMEERETSAAWDDATEEQQVRALIAATRALDRLVWLGYRAGETQALQWPRACVPDPDATASGVNVGSTVVPARLKRAQCEWAYALLGGTYAGDETGLDAFRSVAVGSSLKVELKDTPVQADAVPDRVRREISPYLGAGGSTVQLVRG